MTHLSRKNLILFVTLSLAILLSACSSSNPAQLSIVKSHAAAFTAGSNGTYNISVSNTALGATTGVTTVTDVLPTGMTFVSGTGTGWTCSANGQTVTCTNSTSITPNSSTSISLVVAVASTVTGSVSNTATVANSGDVIAGTNSSTDTMTVNSSSAPHLAITKSHSGNFTAGTNGVFTLAVSNSGTVATTGAITVTDTLPTGLTFVSGTGTNWTCAAAAQVVTCTNPGPIAASAAAGNITLTTAVASSAPASISNTATAATTGSATASSTDTVTVTPTTAPDLAITKSHAGSFTAGTNGVFMIAVSNVGTAATTGAITVTDTLNASFGFVSASGTNWTCAAAAQVVTCTNPGPIANAASAGNIALTVLVAGATSAGNLTNTATVATTGDSNTANNTSTDTVAITAAPDLAITDTATSVFIPGANGTFSIAVNNVSTGPTFGPMTVTDTLNSNFTFVSAAGTGWTCAAAAQVVTCTNPGPIAGGAAAGTITLTVGVNAAATGNISNTATIATTDDNNAANNSSTVSVPIGVNPPDLSITKTAVGVFSASSSASYTIGVSNVGTGSTTGVITVTDTLNSAFTFVSGSGTNWTCTNAAQVVTCTNPGPIAASTSAGNINLTVAVGNSASGSISNTATVATTGDTNAANNSSTATVTIGGATGADVSVLQSHLGNFTAGTNGTFTIGVANEGVGSTTGVITVTDTLNSNFSFVSATGTNWTCSAAAQVVTCTDPGPLAANTSGSGIALVVSVNPAASGTISNTVTVSDPGDTTDTADKSSTQSVTINPAPSAAINLVETGTTPISNSTIQLYAVGTTADGSAATPLFSPALTTNGTGNFTLPTFSCPTPGSLVYITATGGNPGLTTGTDNTAITLMSALGACSAVTSAKPIVINELTTVATVFALETYMTSPTAIGSSAADAADLANDFASVNELVDVTKGTTPGPALPANESVTVGTLNTLADVLAACDATAGGVAGDSSPCGNLFTAATPPLQPASASPDIKSLTARAFLRGGSINKSVSPQVTEPPPTNTAAAAQSMAANPENNVPALSGLVSPTAPFGPQQSSVPTSWNVIVEPGVGGTLNATFASSSLPGGVSSAVGTTVPFFTTVINLSAVPQTLTVVPTTLTSLPVTLLACQTAPATNQCLAPPSASFSVTIPPNTAFASFATFVTFNAAIPYNPVNNIVYLTFADSHGTIQVIGDANVNSIKNVESFQVLSATGSGNGVLTIPFSTGGAGASGAFAVASENIGPQISSVTVSSFTGNSNLPVSVSICQTDPNTGQCLAAPGSSVVVAPFAAQATPTFSVFVTASAAIANDAVNNRIYILFTDQNGNPVGVTSVAVVTN
jgi:uncharacterized repeat protein (TIGR01451 family)